MANHIGQLRKMQVQYLDSDQPVQYSLVLATPNQSAEQPNDDFFEESVVSLNPLIGQQITIDYQQKIQCIACGRVTKKSFNQGYCYPCFTRLAACDQCIMSPEKCHFEQGTCREPQWALDHCMQPHYVYLANSTGIKVGITRGDQIPTRWIDQGAIQALPIFRVTSRYYSGLLEVIYKDAISDRTQWQKMLKGQVEPIDLLHHRSQLFDTFKDAVSDLKQELSEDAIEILEHETVTDINYPVEHYPQKIKSFNLDKQDKIQGVLQGIKGQYLILDSGVINVRKFTGYEVAFSAE